MSGLHYDSLADVPGKVREQAAEKLMGSLAGKRPEGRTEMRSKYGNRKTVANGITFDSVKEARRYQSLMEAMEEGVIEDLRLQVDFTLQEAYTTASGERIRAIRYRADFVYKILHGTYGMPCCIGNEDLEYWSQLYRGAVVIEDVKSRGTRTKEYKIKKKMMADRGCEIREV